MEKVEVFKEEIYQKIKKEMNKNNDYFTQNELEQFTKIYNNSGEI